MPSSSEKQRKYIFFLRGKYKSKKNTPKKHQWIWEKAWEKVEEESVLQQYINKLYEE